jgi:hypothetical protein
MASHRPPQTPVAALIAAFVLIVTAAAVSADAPGNNGTVKVHSGGETEPPVDIRNEPHVTCPFHGHFYFGDSEQSGNWWITDAAGNAVAGGSYDADANGEARTAAIFQPAGHYSLNWEGFSDLTTKHKTFWVEGDCDGGPGG